LGPLDGRFVASVFASINQTRKESSLLRLISKVFFRLEVYGRERLPAAGPFVLCPNHESFLDGPLVSAALPFHILEGQGTRRIIVTGTAGTERV
jgi:1-acyl-sn-glycerol-3-phosphate acyltransferase